MCVPSLTRDPFHWFSADLKHNSGGPVCVCVCVCCRCCEAEWKGNGVEGHHLCILHAYKSINAPAYVRKRFSHPAFDVCVHVQEALLV